MTTRESAVTEAAGRVAAFLAERRTMGGLDADYILGANHEALRVSDLEAVLAALDTTPQPALACEVFNPPGGCAQSCAPVEDWCAPCIRAHQPTPPAQAEAVAGEELDAAADALEDDEVAFNVILGGPSYVQYWLRTRAETARAVVGGLTTARAIADTAAAEAGSADTAARVRRTGGD